MRKFLMVAASAAVLAGGAGCSALGKQMFKQPDVKVQDVKLTGLGLNGGSLDVVLSVGNPNDFRLDATRLTYKLLVDSVTFATGTADQRFTVEGGKTEQIHLPLSFTFAGVGTAGRQLLNTGSVQYTVLGDVTVGSPVGNFTVPYRQTGNFSTLGGRSR